MSCSQVTGRNGVSAADRAAIDAYVQRHPVEAPPLTENQREALAMLLRPMALGLRRRRQEHARTRQAVPLP